jgi:hypothetical protein
MSLKRTLQHVALCLGCLAILGAAAADTVKLKDGTVLEGDIISEDETQLTLTVVFASGTISFQEVIRKSDIAEVIRLTPEQKTERDMEKAYERLKKYQLDVRRSGPVSYYDQVIKGVFLRFLQQYPSSPYTNDVDSKILQWQTERDKVAAGLAKWDGQWMEASEAAKLAEQARAQFHLERNHGPTAITNQPRSTPVESAGEPSALTDVTDWLKRYWIYGAVAAVVGLWLVSRLFTKQ